VINRETLSEQATHNQTTEINVAREYCQHLFLRSFYQQKGSERVMFRGGTALKIVYGSPRFSEDLDFSGFGVHLHQIEDWILETLGEIELSTIGVDIQESKTTSGGYLSILNYQLYDYHIRVQLEISLREQNDIQGQGVLLTPETLPAYTLTLLPEIKLVEEKIDALLTRSKPRDFFDLYFLLRKGLITPEMKPGLDAVKVILQDLRMDFQSELSQFLPRSHQVILRDFQTTLSNELSRHGV
jgi:predicted nucleotidyltransferase component of viral defense system